MDDVSSARARATVRESLFWGEDDTEAPLRPVSGSPEEAVLVMGTFDGLHKGHRALVSAAVRDAARRGVACRPVTFHPDPSEVLVGARIHSQLLSHRGRMRGLRALGADAPLVLPFTTELAALTPEAFVAEALMPLVRPASVHVGSNFHFGRGASGDVATLRRLGERHGFEVCEHRLLEEGGERVSSTRIRGLLAEEGGLAQANDLLARCHFVEGEVAHGRGEGAGLGFATANVRCPARSCLPHAGVYAGYVTQQGRCWPAAINVGAAPSFEDARDLFLEAHLIGFAGDIYGEEVSVSFARWLRASRPFDSLDELRRVVLADIAWTRENLGEGEVRLS